MQKEMSDDDSLIIELSKDEKTFLNWVRWFMPKTREDKPKRDVDVNAYIHADKLEALIQKQADAMELEPEQVEKLLLNVDANNDHYIDFSEFCSLMNKAKSMRMKNVLFFAAKMVVPKGARGRPISYLQRYNCFPPPLFMLLISIIEVAIYVYYVIAMKTPFFKILEEPEPRNSSLIFDWVKAQEAWRYVTYIFIHIGVSHIVFNVLTQIVLGIPLELVHKQWRVCTVYFSGVIAGSLFVAVVDRGALAGASAGVYALLAAHISELLVNWAEMEYAIVRAACLLIIIAGDFGSAIYMTYTAESPTRVSHAAHLAGFFAGVLMGVIVLRNFRTKRWEKVMWWIAVALTCASFTALIVLNIVLKILK